MLQDNLFVSRCCLEYRSWGLNIFRATFFDIGWYSATLTKTRNLFLKYINFICLKIIGFYILHQNHRAIILSFQNIECFCYNSIPIQHRRLDAPEHSPDKYSPEQDKLSSWQVPSLARQAESAPGGTKNQFYANDKILHENLLPFNFFTLYCFERRYISTYQSEKLSRQDVNQQSII